VQHRKIAVSFRDLCLLSVFKVALVALRQLLDNRADAKLKEQVNICILMWSMMVDAHLIARICLLLSIASALNKSAEDMQGFFMNFAVLLPAGLDARAELPVV
jgi:hypothetical protein